MAQRGAWGGELGHVHAEGLTSAGTGTFTYDTAITKTGVRSYKYDAKAALYTQYAWTGATDVTYYAAADIYIPSGTGFPLAAARILAFLTSGAVLHHAIQLGTDGRLRLRRGDGTFVGSASAILSTNTWYRIELSDIITAGNDTWTFRLDGSEVATETASLASNPASQLRWGWVDTPGGTNRTIHIDNVILNDSSGSVNNTWVGEQGVIALLPAADSSLGNWRDGAGGTTNIFGSVDNIPPTGVATASSGATNQIENSTSAAANNYDATMQDYLTAGIPSGATITAIQTVVEVGSSSTTGTDTISHSVVSNPAIAAGTATSCDIVAGTYPTSWNQGVGTMTENPTVTLGTAPVMRVTKNIATTRINSVALMAMVVTFTPPPPETPVAADDSQAISQTEVSAPAISSTSADSQGISQTEAQSREISSTLADTQAISQSEAADVDQGSIPKAADDAQALGSSESISIQVSFSIADSQNLSQVELAALSIASTLGDTQALSQSETSVIAVSFTMTDAQNLSQNEATSIEVALTTADTQGVSQSESAEVSETAEKSATDAQDISQAESVATAITSTISDTQAISQAEEISLGATFTAEDAQGLGQSESVAMAIASTITDTQAISQTELAEALETAAKSADDAQTISQSEDTTIAAALSSSDSQTLADSESISLAAALLIPDTQVLLGDEFAGTGGYDSKTADDTQPLSQSESTSLAVAMVIGDAQALSQTEATETSASFTITESLLLNPSHWALVEGATENKSATDSQSLGVVETIGTLWAMELTDSQSLFFSDISATSASVIVGDENGIRGSELFETLREVLGVDSQSIVALEAINQAVGRILVDAQVLGSSEDISLSMTAAHTIAEAASLRTEEFLVTGVTITKNDTQILSMVDAIELSIAVQKAVSDAQTLSISDAVYPYAEHFIHDAQGLSISEAVIEAIVFSVEDEGVLAPTADATIGIRAVEAVVLGQIEMTSIDLITGVISYLVTVDAQALSSLEGTRIIDNMVPSGAPVGAAGFGIIGGLGAGQTTVTTSRGGYLGAMGVSYRSTTAEGD
jgi:hypothetical protein